MNERMFKATKEKVQTVVIISANNRVSYFIYVFSGEI